LERHQVATVERTTSAIAPEAFGLSLEEGKSLVQEVQARIVQTQTDVVAASERKCMLCKRKQLVRIFETGVSERFSGALRSPAVAISGAAARASIAGVCGR
jgi:hypothetical protein